MDELILLPEDQALCAFFDDFDRNVLLRFLSLATAGSLLGCLVLLAGGMGPWVLAPLFCLVSARLLRNSLDHPWFERHFRGILLAYLGSQLAVIRLSVAFAEEWQPMYHPVDFLLPLVLLFFALRRSHLALLLVPLWGLSAGRDLITSIFSETEAEYLPLIGTTLWATGVFLWVTRQTLKRRQDFLLVWRRESQRHRERHRMREELDEARRIQLSMLPRSDPSSELFDIAGISIPASEVGGDYYEYFKSGDSAQAVVVADVAGHGVASGLLLAGVRSCLYLLKDKPRSPVDVLSLLDPVVRETTGRREFVTMIYVLFDHDENLATLASAGHPPLLRFEAATGLVHEVEVSSLPLGARLRKDFEEHATPFAGGDIFLLYTDGIAETVNPWGELYGNDRLSERLKAMSHDRTAKEIRDTLLGDVWTFKADGEQTDDITLVVVKIR